MEKKERKSWREKAEEIWKLLELLNEYETPRSWVVYKSYDDYDWFFYWVDCDWETEIAWSDSLIFSKKYWFIKWLVENEKIDLDGYPDIDFFNGDVNNLLMYLAIQDEPIEFLVSILK